MKALRTHKEYGFMVALLLVFAFMLTLNNLTPLFADDYFYSLNLRTEQHINGFGDILYSIAHFRKMHNGRIAAHFFAQVFLWLPKMAFNVMNAAMCTLLVYISCCYIHENKEKRDAGTALAVFSLIWLLMPGFGHSALWLTGSCSYLWAITFIAIFIYPFFRYYNFPEREKSKAKPIRETVAVLYAFFVGSYSENGAFSALAITFCFLLLIYIREKKIPLNLGLRFAVAAAGFLFLMLAPSELGKKNKDTQGELFPLLENAGITGGILAALFVVALFAVLILLWGILRHRKKFCRIMAIGAAVAIVAVSALLAVKASGQASGLLSKVSYIVSDTKLSIVLLAGPYFILLMLTLKENCDIRKILSAVALGIGAALSVAIFIVASYFPARGVCVATVYIAIADILLFRELKPTIRKSCTHIVIAVLALLFGLTTTAALPDIISVDKQFEQRLEIITQAQEQGIDKLHLEPLLAESKYSAVWQGEAADYYPAMEILFGIKSITIEGAEEFK